jgi:hypothetical protein
MVEISDRPFGGVSNQTKISWTTERFREALLEIADPETRDEAIVGLTANALKGESRVIEGCGWGWEWEWR